MTIGSRREIAPFVDAIAFIVEARDPYLSGHQRRVGLLSEAIALRMGMSVDDSALVRLSGELHDVGKIATPLGILNRSGRLSGSEMEIVKRHSLTGEEILRLADCPWPLALVAGQHHERLDGSGYPRGLTADEIVLPAKIVAVADVVEAMSSHRPYRPSMGTPTALDEVADGAGRLYDATVVGICLELFVEGFTFDDLSDQ
jgi:HD-GYP domain-containing protein (c-di-GMP phosphodiesterase class II)